MVGAQAIDALYEKCGLEDSYRLVHDRVREAAYSLIPETSRAQAHLRIGKLLLAQTPPEQREEAIFDIVNQLNRGAALITEQEERDQLAELNLIAGKRARGSAAYASALTYLNAGAALLPDDIWERQHELIFALELNRAECEFLTGALGEAEARLSALSTRAASAVERVSVTCVRADLYTTLGQSSRPVGVGVDYLRRLGFELPLHPTDDDVRREYERMWSQLDSRAIEDLIELPLMTDPASLATMDVLTKVGPAAFTEANFHALAICWAANLSFARGNSDGSCDVYVRLGFIAGDRFGDYDAGFRFGKLGYDLVERRGLKRFQARTYLMFAHHVFPYARPIPDARVILHHGFEAANQSGDLNFMGWYSCFYSTENLFAAGDALVDVQREAERGLAFAHRAELRHVIDVIQSFLGLVRMLRGLTRKFGSFDDEQFEERRMEARFANNPNAAFADCMYCVRKLRAHFHAGDYASAIEMASRAQRNTSSGLLYQVLDLCFYGALSHSAACVTASAYERKQHLNAVAAYHQQLQVRSKHCPQNFENRAALVGGEIARIEGRDSDAMRLYEQALRSAHDNGFVHNEALAYEVAARFYAARGFEEIARLYLRRAHEGYRRWGADGKVRQLEEMHPHLRTEPALGPTSTIATPVERLDLATVIKVSQAVSGKMAPEKLIDTLMRTALEQAGAERGLLILSRAAGPEIEAEATTSGDTVSVHLRTERVTASVLAEAVLHYVLRSRESVILDDAAAKSLFADDPYIQEREARSILCLPLINQAKLIGALYLENNLTRRAFAPARIAVLKLLASQAATALENARLYRDLEQREAKIRGLVDANIIGICVVEGDRRILEANEAFLCLVGYDRDDLLSGLINWMDLTPPAWRDRSAQAASELTTTGAGQPFEKEYIRKDGSRVPVLVGAARIGGSEHQHVSFMLDLTERKRAEAEVRDSERRYAAVQAELAHANRVATMGQLTVSIAHEVNQPIAAAVINAQAALRWLRAERPDIEGARRALGRILENGNRASEVIGRIRTLVKKAPPRKDAVAVNDAILEVVALTRGEAVKNRVSVRTQLAESLPVIKADRVQLQQVILNLIVNAIEAMSATDEAPRHLLLGSERAEPDGVLVTVRDSGAGLASDARERLFDAFYTTKVSGMGMGLSICRSIVEAHGGRLWAGANEPRGATFQFTLSANPQQVEEAEASSSTES